MTIPATGTAEVVAEVVVVGAGAAGAASGAIGAINMVGSLVGAGAAVVGDVILARIHTDTGRIEENTRYTQLYLAGQGSGSILWWMQEKLPVLDYLWSGLQRIEQETFKLFDITDLLTNIRDEMRLNLYPQMATVASGSIGSVTINVSGAGDSDAVAELVMSKLRTQMGVA